MELKLLIDDLRNNMLSVATVNQFRWLMARVESLEYTLQILNLLKQHGVFLSTDNMFHTLQDTKYNSFV